MIFLIFIVSAFLLFFFVARPLTVVIHELGHAIPAILLTKQKVSIYIGSYGDPNNSVHFKITQLEIWFKYNPFKWRLGLCSFSINRVSTLKEFIYLICGPLASFIIAIVSSYVVFHFDTHGFLKFIVIIFFSSAIFDLFINLIPNENPAILFSGKKVYNDGQQLKLLLSHSKFPKEYDQAIELYNNSQYFETGILLEKIISKIKQAEILRLGVKSFLLAKEYKKAKRFDDILQQKYQMTSDDYANSGLIKSHLNLHEEGLLDYDKSLILNPDNFISLNNKGYTLNIIEEYQTAISYFDKAIQITSDFAYSYSNRGLAKIKLGEEQEGLNDIQHSLRLDPNNSYAYRNLGIYHLDQGENEKAMQLFVKAKELDNDTHMIDDLIEKTQRK